MSREDRKERIAALHREQILKAAEVLFTEKGYAQTTIDDIAKNSEYSRRTIYAYFESKEDILHHIIRDGLLKLKGEIEAAVYGKGTFPEQYGAVCAAMYRYQTECPHSANNVNRAAPRETDLSGASGAVKDILTLGTEINTILAEFLTEGQKKGEVRKSVVPQMAVYVLWSSITSFITLFQTKGNFLCGALGVSGEAFLEYGFKQIINSVLEERI